MVALEENSVTISATLEQKDALRYTLASVPILDLKLGYKGLVEEAGIQRKLNFSFTAVAIGEAALKLQNEELNSQLLIKGFITNSSARSSKLVLHITEYEKGV